jgi:hypothetical protein
MGSEALQKDSAIPLVTVMEATGVYYEQCAFFLFKAGYIVSIILPNKAKKYLQATGLKSKNDKIDSKGLSRMAAEQSLPVWQPMDDLFYQLKALTRQYQSWVITRKMEPVTASQFSFEEAGIIKNSADQKPAIHKVINRQNITV